MAYNLRTGLIGSGDIDVNVSLTGITADNITSGVFGLARIPTLDDSKISDLNADYLGWWFLDWGCFDRSVIDKHFREIQSRCEATAAASRSGRAVATATAVLIALALARLRVRAQGRTSRTRT